MQTVRNQMDKKIHTKKKPLQRGNIKIQFCAFKGVNQKFNTKIIQFLTFPTGVLYNFY